MPHVRHLRALAVLALSITLGHYNAAAQQIQTVFVIAMENHNWTQPVSLSGGIQQIFQNPNAPFINSLVNGSATAVINGRTVNISQQVSYATNYRNVLATAGGNNPHIHPSEPNYLWAEAATNFGVFNDSDPFSPQPLPTAAIQNQDNQLHLTRLLTQCGVSWRSYQEDIDLMPDGTSFDNTVLPRNQWTVPIKSLSGTFVIGVNQFNGSAQFNYAVKHNPMAFFTDTNGGNDTTPSNPQSQQYAPLQQLFSDLANNAVAQYNWITPDQFNDQHTALKGGFMGLTGDAANIAQGDNFLRQVIPAIMASRAYRNNGAIIIWWDESEQDGVANDNPDDLTHTIGEIVISPDAHPNEGGAPFASDVYLTHSSDVRTIQEIFSATAPFFLGDAIHANDLSSLFAAGPFPNREMATELADKDRVATLNRARSISIV